MYSKPSRRHATISVTPEGILDSHAFKMEKQHSGWYWKLSPNIKSIQMFCENGRRSKSPYNCTPMPLSTSFPIYGGVCSSCNSFISLLRTNRPGMEARSPLIPMHNPRGRVSTTAFSRDSSYIPPIIPDLSPVDFIQHLFLKQFRSVSFWHLVGLFLWWNSHWSCWWFREGAKHQTSWFHQK